MKELVAAITNLEEEAAVAIVEKKLQAGVSAHDILAACNEGLIAVGDLFSEGEYFLTELMFSGEIMNSIMEKLTPYLSAGETTATKGKVVIGTVLGDIHDVGKNIVINLLKGHGYEVIDLGIDVPAAEFVKAVRETGTKVLGLSALLNSTYPEMKTVIDELKKAGLRDSVKVIIGGTICSEKVREFTGADDFATTAIKGVHFCNSVYGHE